MRVKSPDDVWVMFGLLRQEVLRRQGGGNLTLSLVPFAHDLLSHIGRATAPGPAIDYDVLASQSQGDAWDIVPTVLIRAPARDGSKRAKTQRVELLTGSPGVKDPHLLDRGGIAQPGDPIATLDPVESSARALSLVIAIDEEGRFRPEASLTSRDKDPLAAAARDALYHYAQ